MALCAARRACWTPFCARCQAGPTSKLCACSAFSNAAPHALPAPQVVAQRRPRLPPVRRRGQARSQPRAARAQPCSTLWRRCARAGRLQGACCCSPRGRPTVAPALLPARMWRPLWLPILQSCWHVSCCRMHRCRCRQAAVATASVAPSRAVRNAAALTLRAPVQANEAEAQSFFQAVGALAARHSVGVDALCWGSDVLAVPVLQRYPLCAFRYCCRRSYCAPPPAAAAAAAATLTAPPAE